MPTATKVLVVDDSEPEFVLLNHWARSASVPLALTWQPDPEQALLSLRSGAFDVCLVDYQMGAMTGVEFLALAVEAAPDCPFIMVTGCQDREVDLQAMSLGATDFLDKNSLTARGLERSVRYALAHADRQAALQASAARHQAAADGAMDGVWEWDLRSGLLEVSDRWLAMLGYGRATAPTSHAALARLVHPDDLAGFTAAIKTAADDPDTPVHVEHRLRHPGGDYRWFLTRGKVRRDLSGEPRLICGQVDITKRREREEANRRLALHDPLTGLPNRLQLEQCIEQALQRPRGPAFCLMFLDLDGFKGVNDAHGHEAGDRVLIETARRIRQVLRRGDVAARVGGDEFVVLLDGCADRTDADRIADLIRTELEQPFGTDPLMHVGVSVGIRPALSGDDVDDLLRSADAAMYEDKASRRARLPTVVARDIEAARVEAALHADEFEVYYEPIVSLPSHAIIGRKALLRWNHPELGVLPPRSFVAAASRSGVAAELGGFVLAHALQTTARWHHDGVQPTAVHVNVAAAEMLAPGYERRVADELRRAGVDGRALCLELVDDGTDPEQLQAMWARLAPIGVRLALDDFGCASVALDRLATLPFDEVKLHRGLLAGRTDRFATVVDAVVRLATSLDSVVTAAGVETAADEEWVSARGIRRAQGRRFGLPARAGGDQRGVA